MDAAYAAYAASAYASDAASDYASASASAASAYASAASAAASDYAYAAAYAAASAADYAAYAAASAASAASDYAYAASDAASAASAASAYAAASAAAAYASDASLVKLIEYQAQAVELTNSTTVLGDWLLENSAAVRLGTLGEALARAWRWRLRWWVPAERALAERFVERPVLTQKFEVARARRRSRRRRRRRGGKVAIDTRGPPWTRYASQRP